MKKYINLIVIAISGVTILSGLVQVVAPAFVLDFIGADTAPASRHFFAIIGMFMALFGGLMLNVVYSARPSKSATFWCALQKLGASIAVLIGIYNDIFSLLAAGIALFDLLSGILFLYYMKTISDFDLSG